MNKRKTRKVAIVGTHSAGLDVEIPADYEVWVINDGWRLRPSYDRLYELHRLEERPWRSREHLREIRGNEKVWTLFPDRIKGANILPVQEILGKYPAYFTNSGAWMVAHALHEGVSHIYLLGLHFLSPRERLLERPCIEFWIGYAKGLGVEVTVPAVSPLLKGRGLYGLEDSLHNAAAEVQDFCYAAVKEGAIERFSYSGFYAPDEDVF